MIFFSVPEIVSSDGKVGMTDSWQSVVDELKLNFDADIGTLKQEIRKLHLKHLEVELLGLIDKKVKLPKASEFVKVFSYQSCSSNQIDQWECSHFLDTICQSFLTKYPCLKSPKHPYSKAEQEKLKLIEQFPLINVNNGSKVSFNDDTRDGSDSSSNNSEIQSKLAVIELQYGQLKSTLKSLSNSFSEYEERCV